MPRFYFHLHDALDVQDEEGKELPDLLAARAYASRQARSILNEMLKDEGHIVLHHRIDIENENGQVLDAVRFADVVNIES